MNHSLNIKPVNRYKIKPNEEKEFREVDFGTSLCLEKHWFCSKPAEMQKTQYVDVYEGIL